jgi:hypothetical protein
MSNSRVNGNVGVVGRIYNPGASLKFFKITVQDSSQANIDLTAEEGTLKAVEAIFFSFPTGIIAYEVVNANSGIIYLIVDGVNAPDAATLQNAIRALGTSVGTNGIDVTGSDVVAGTNFTVA